MRIFYSGVLLLSACANSESAPQPVPLQRLAQYTFVGPCGRPDVGSQLPDSSGIFFVYALQDSLRMAHCLFKPGMSGAQDTVPINYDYDMLLAFHVRQQPLQWCVVPEKATLRDSMLHIYLKIAPAANDSAQNSVWKFNLRDVKLVKVLWGTRDFAYLAGPAWNGSPMPLSATEH